jgi:MarR family 2-MHQ and catechol resistance regulon transcriptional repressor
MPADRPHVEAYVKLIRTAEALHAQVSRGLVGEGLTASQFSALKALRFHGPMPQKGVASYLLKTAGNVTFVLDNLEKQGLVTRHRQRDDRRLVSVSLTELGQETFDRLYPAHIERITKAMSPLDLQQMDQLTELLQELHTAINEPKCGPDEEEAAAREAV